ncbi:MAG: DUF1697 domain-containing protein [Polyangiaceae bacterium]|nr:DUF1697 domain-containing protein [Polyangiaceae bacterium]
MAGPKTRANVKAKPAAKPKAKPKAKPAAKTKPNTAGRTAALLRGINVGRNKRVSMSDLKALVEELGFGDVRTLLNSGNVVFSGGKSPAKDAARIEKAIADKLGVTSRVICLGADDLATVMQENSLRDVAEEPTRLYVTILGDKADRARLLPLLKEDWSPDALAVGSLAVYAWCPNGMLESRLTPAVDRILRERATARNWATLTKIAALVLPEEDG